MRHDRKQYLYRLYNPMGGELRSNGDKGGNEKSISTLRCGDLEMYVGDIEDKLKQIDWTALPGGLASFLQDRKLKENVTYMIPHAKDWNGGAWNVLEIQTKKSLSNEEIQQLSEEWQKIAIHGWGKDFGNQAIPVQGGDLYVLLGGDDLQIDFILLESEQKKRVMKNQRSSGEDCFLVTVFADEHMEKIGYRGAQVKLPADINFLADDLQRAYVRDGQYTLQFDEGWPDFLVPVLFKMDTVSLEEANLLAYQLAEMEERQLETLEGALTLRMEADIGSAMSIRELINLTGNLECYDFYPGVRNDRELGDICLDGGLCELVDGLPDEVIDLLDPEKVGQQMRRDEQGTYTPKGYVHPNTISQQELYDGTILPEIAVKPCGIISLRMVCVEYPEEYGVWLELPATKQAMKWVLNELGETTFENCFIAESVSAVLGYPLAEYESIDKLNLLAKRVSAFPDEKSLMKYKGILELEQCSDLNLALDLAENLDCYSLDAQIYAPARFGEIVFEEVGIDITDPAFSAFDFDEFGKRRLKADGFVLTPYGVIVRDNIPFRHEYTEEPGPGMSLQ